MTQIDIEDDSYEDIPPEELDRTAVPTISLQISQPTEPKQMNARSVREQNRLESQQQQEQQEQQRHSRKQQTSTSSQFKSEDEESIPEGDQPAKKVRKEVKPVPSLRSGRSTANCFLTAIVSLFATLCLLVAVGYVGYTYQSRPEHVTLTVHEGQEFKRMDRDSESDPYCEIIFGDTVVDSTTTHWDTKSPQFQHTFSTQLDANVTTVLVQIYDMDEISTFAPRRLGVASIDIRRLKKGEDHTRWIDLQPNMVQDTTGGSVKITVKVYHENLGFSFLEIAALGGLIALSIVFLVIAVKIRKGKRKKEPDVEDRKEEKR